MPRRRQKKRKNDYFTQLHEDAIIEYVATEDNKVRTELYIKLIQPAFNEMVDKITYTYKFTSLPNIDSLKEECKIWLTTILDKYDHSKGSKAFSYFSVITKNWFIHRVKKNAKNMQREIHMEDLSADLEQRYLSVEDSYVAKRQKAEFWYLLNKEIESWENLKLKDNEKKVLEAIKIILSRSEEIEIFNKKAIYLYIREITGLNTKQVVNNLNRIRFRYRTFKKNWESGKT